MITQKFCCDVILNYFVNLLWCQYNLLSKKKKVIKLLSLWTEHFSFESYDSIPADLLCSYCSMQFADQEISFTGIAKNSRAIVILTIKKRSNIALQKDQLWSLNLTLYLVSFSDDDPVCLPVLTKWFGDLRTQLVIL